MSRRLQRTTGPKRALAALVLALFALGWLADRAHVAYEAHAYCAEHQQLEHATNDHGHARGDSTAHGHVRDEAAAHARERDELARHEHAGDELAHHEHTRDDLAHHDLAHHDHGAPPCGPTIEAFDGALEAHTACCLLLGRGDEPLALPAVLALAFGPAHVERAPPISAHGTSARGSIPVLALAPKQSPPAV